MCGAVVLAFSAAADTNSVVLSNSAPANLLPAGEPIEKEFQQIMADDDAAHEQIDEWIRSNQELAAKGEGVSREDLNRRIMDRLEPIRKRYETFLKNYPEHERGHVAFGSFLNDLNDEDGAVEQWEKALAINSKDPAVYNNLAEIYAHHGPVLKAFDYYTKAIELNPRESLYYHNFGTVVYLFRQDAMQFYHITEQQVFDKALELYQKAMKLDPDNFPLASDVAQTFYGIKPTRTEDALKAWTNALNIAHDEIEREGVYIHFARVKLHAGRLAEARQHLASVTNTMYADLKKRIARNLEEKEKELSGTNSPAPK